MDDWIDDAKQLKYAGLNWTGIAKQLAPRFPNLTFEQVYEKVRHLDKSHHKKVVPTLMSPAKVSYDYPTNGITMRETNPIDYKQKQTYGTNTLVFSDTHMPFNHPNYLQFLIDTYEKYNCGSVVCLGDLVDNHAISRHQTETCAKSPYDELDQTIIEVAKYVKAFPNVKMVYGNHDLIGVRQAATLGIGERFLRTLNELLELPPTWVLDDEFIIDDVLYRHGMNCSGVNGALNSALRERMSTCIGHTHSNAGVSYAANKRNIIFGAHCGCGISVSAYAFAYGTHSKNRPILGCTVVYSSAKAEFIPMAGRFFRST